MTRIRTYFSIVFSIVTLCLIVILFALLGLFQNRKEFGKSIIGRHEGVRISDQIRERNEDLTHCCLNYILTGDSTWVIKYHTLIETSAYRLPKKGSGFTILKDSIRTLGFGEKEFTLLREAIQLSQLLNKKEAEAFKMFALYQQNKSTKEQALSIISSEAYLQTKQELNTLIVRFEDGIESQTTQTWQQNISEGMQMYRMVIIALFIVIIFAVITFVMIFKRLKKEEEQDTLFKKGVEKLKITQHKLLKSEERFNLAVEGSGVRIWDFDVAKKQVIWAPPHLKLLGYELNEIKPTLQYIFEHMHHDDRELFEEQLTKHIKTDTPLAIDARFYNKQGQLKWYRCIGTSSRDKNGQAKRIVGIFVDITDRVNKEEETTNAILETEDKERSRIARDIHDSLQQTMSVSLLNFEKVRASLVINDDNLQQNFSTAYQYLKEAISESRSLAHNLMPKIVDKEGLNKATEALIGALKDSTPTQITYYSNLNKERLKLSAEMSFYRIIQEALNNVIKYAKADECAIQLIKHENMVSLTIEDDGVGFNINEIKHSFGIHNMKARAESIGAHIQVESSKGRGTQIIIELTL
ncbi:sensor histidine kinase [Labilibacter marinus]|uniref:sensor histidine kinase n=1 Tax=Labilibacter marinus TaxID=1477105 RepID=UPI00094FCD8E|nr:PAS domain-containing protein [Labilibacter marinus]